MPKTSPIRSTVSIEHRQTWRDTERVIIIIFYLFYFIYYYYYYYYY